LPDRVIGAGVHRVIVRVASGDLVRVRAFELRNESAKVADFALVETPDGGRGVWE
jgi:hypothetical protein